MPRSFPAAFLCLLVMLCGVSCKAKKKAAPMDVEMILERVSSSKAKTPQDVQPYDEAIAWHEYKVRKVLHGETGPERIRVAHWTVLGAKAVPVSSAIGEVTTLKLVPFESLTGISDIAASDDLDFNSDEPRYLDLTQTRAASMTPSVMRMDYGGFISEQMTLYWKLRAQLKLVVMGHSHAAKGIAPRYFFNPENQETPVAFNLAPAGSSVHLQATMIREYVMPLPKVEWVVWVASPRLFNGMMEDVRKEKDFLNSPGWRYDQQNKDKLWPVPSDARKLSAESIDLKTLGMGNVDIWGWEGRMKSRLPETQEEARKELLDEMSVAKYQFNESRWEEFICSVRELNQRNVRVLLLITPIHPLVKEAACADPDGTTHDGYREVIQKLEALDKELPLTWFKDFNQDGHHDYEHQEFYDVDHLNRKGSHKLTKRIVEWLTQCGKETPVEPKQSN